MRGVGFEPTDSLRDRISYVQISAFLSPARLTRLRYPLAKEKMDDLFKKVSKQNDLNLLKISNSLKLQHPSQKISLNLQKLAL